MTRTRSTPALLLLLALGLLQSCWSEAGPQVPEGEKQLILPIRTAGPGSLDPVRGSTTYDNQELADAADPEARRAELVEDYTQRLANPYLAAERGYVDDVIEPSQTRRKLIAGMRLLESKREEIPERKHGNVPL